LQTNATKFPGADEEHVFCAYSDKNTEITTGLPLHLSSVYILSKPFYANLTRFTQIESYVHLYYLNMSLIHVKTCTIYEHLMKLILQPVPSRTKFKTTNQIYII